MLLHPALHLKLLSRATIFKALFSPVGGQVRRKVLQISSAGGSLAQACQCYDHTLVYMWFDMMVLDNSYIIEDCSKVWPSGPALEWGAFYPTGAGVHLQHLLAEFWIQTYVIYALSRHSSTAAPLLTPWAPGRLQY
jgi:hypothetical protein